MSHQSTMSRAAPFSLGDRPSLPLSGANFTRPASLQTTQPVFTGLATPPESPIQFIQRCEPSETAHGPFSSSEVEPRFPSHASSQPTLFDLQSFTEEIYSIIEQAVEQKMSDAMGPLRLNVNRLDDSLHLHQSTFESLKSHLHRENGDLQDQNDTLSRQIDLHYRTVEQHKESFDSHVKAMNAMIEAQSKMFETQSTMIETQSKNIQATTENMTVAAGMIGHLSQVVTNLPVAINQVVHNAVQQQTQMAMRDILNAQQQAMLSIAGVSQTRQSVSSNGDARPLNRCYHGLEIESLSSTQHDMSFDSQSSHTSTFKSKSSFRYKFSKLFKCGRRRQ